MACSSETTAALQPCKPSTATLPQEHGSDVMPGRPTCTLNLLVGGAPLEAQYVIVVPSPPDLEDLCTGSQTSLTAAARACSTLSHHLSHRRPGTATMTAALQARSPLHTRLGAWTIQSLPQKLLEWKCVSGAKAGRSAHKIALLLCRCIVSA